MSDWFDELSSVNKEAVAAIRKAGWWEGFRQNLVEKYPDEVHFVYELLQNAEDQNATTAIFELSSNCLVFRHNGTPFTQQDVENITSIGNSHKPQQENKIGRFGIGFKSVFAVSERPEIFTALDGKPFAFTIEDLGVPIRISHREDDTEAGVTKFVLHFIGERAEKLYKDIERKLRSLGADTMLFLNHLEEISWCTRTDEGFYLCQRDSVDSFCDLIEEAGGKDASKTVQDTKYLVFDRSVKISADRPLTVRLAFRFEDGTIVPEPGQSTLNVYFPTKEQTHLMFRLHAPFLLSPDRASLKEGDETNVQLMEECATLLVDTLVTLRERKLLSAAVLNCLPIRRFDFMGLPFEPLFTAVRSALRTSALLPTDTAGWVTAGAVRLPSGDPLRRLLSTDQLVDLYAANTPIKWLSEEITERKTLDLLRYLTNEVGVEEIDPDKFARQVTHTFLKQQPDDWMIEFYKFLSSTPSLWRKRSIYPEAGPLRYKTIIRLESGANVSPFDRGTDTPNAYLPPAGETQFPIVKRAIAQNPEALEFLKALGLQEPDLFDEVMQRILPKYTGGMPGDDYFQDLDSIALALSKSSEHRSSDLIQAIERAFLIDCVDPVIPDGHVLRRHDQVYLSNVKTDAWFGGNSEIWQVHSSLAAHESFQDILSHPEIGCFIISDVYDTVNTKSWGPTCFVEISSGHGSYKRGRDGFDSGADIIGLKYALANITLARAEILWKLLLRCTHLIRGVIEFSTRKGFDDPQSFEHWSRLGTACRDSTWLPDMAGKFHKPCEISLADLHPSLDRESLQAKELSVKFCMKQGYVIEAAEQLGIPLADLEYFKQNLESFQEWRASRQPKPEFPDSPIPDTVRRTQKVFDYALDAPEREYAEKVRSVRTSNSALHPEKVEYLRDQYTNLGEMMICQACEDEMPFKLKSGKYYFVAVECVRGWKKELRENYLALCPICAAKYLFANDSSPEEIGQAIADATGDTIEVLLAGEDATIRFNSTHLFDLRAVLSAQPRDK